MSTLRSARPARGAAAHDPRVAIIDIGSNSVRLVVYQGPARLPAVLFNEKVMAGLGRSLAQSGAIETAALHMAASALARFALLAREMRVDELRVVATAAVRDASNGQQLVDAAARLGLEVEVLSGGEEASAAGMGVISAIPDADGIVGDLGGGSLELVRVVAGTVTDRASFPLGVLRVPGIRGAGKGALDAKVGELLARSGWKDRGRDLPFYLVGGSWRALARLDMHRTGYPLPVVHQYTLPNGHLGELQRLLADTPRGVLKAVPDLSSARIPQLGDAAALLEVVLRHLGATRAVASAYGLREGLLYQRLSPEQRLEDPLIAAARDEGARAGRFPEHGDLLDNWVAPLFAEDPPELARLRHAACLLADVGWRANPEFRAERGMEIALHGNWVAIDAAGRAVVAQALFTSLGGRTGTPAPLSRLADAPLLTRARQWGLAMRLGQRLSAGVAEPLRRSRLSLGDGKLALALKGRDAALYGEAVEKRHKALAAAMGAAPVLSI